MAVKVSNVPGVSPAPRLLRCRATDDTPATVPRDGSRKNCRSRRQFLASTVGGCLYSLSAYGADSSLSMTTRSIMAFELPSLPYLPNALEPYISARTFEFHHGKHHAAYVTNTNALIKDTPLAGKSLEEVIKSVAGDPDKTSLFNNAAQVWNHTFFWNSMKPGGGGVPTGDLARWINSTFGSLEKFKEEFKSAAVTQFGSGWTWLVLENGTLQVTKTANADTPMVHGQKALLTCDVWEHAYYLDYQNRRPDFVQAFLDHLVNWDFVTRTLAD
ncbi:Superoxide dismutase [Fe] [invertebrate metagenome]|uniref:Superoxide dismutase [Fe] n=1 Tax=invertebrate metagenome TaxID=1711999 RepID=A0A484H4Z8_9ZZZZ